MCVWIEEFLKNFFLSNLIINGQPGSKLHSLLRRTDNREELTDIVYAYGALNPSRNRIWCILASKSALSVYAMQLRNIGWVNV